MIETNGEIPKKGEGLIKAGVILKAWRNYRRTSWIYRVLEWFGFR